MLKAESAKSGARIDALGSTVFEEAGRVEVKSLVRQFNAAVKIVCRDGAVEGLTSEHFAVGDAMTGTPKMLIYLERKGRILDMIDELNTIARIAFDGEAEIRAKFNKDLLLRSARTRAKDAPPPTDPA